MNPVPPIGSPSSHQLVSKTSERLANEQRAEEPSTAKPKVDLAMGAGGSAAGKAYSEWTEDEVTGGERHSCIVVCASSKRHPSSCAQESKRWVKPTSLSRRTLRKKASTVRSTTVIGQLDLADHQHNAFVCTILRRCATQ